eukprot:1177656-Prorocentrum_minimum.AAC.3
MWFAGPCIQVIEHLDKADGLERTLQDYLKEINRTLCNVSSRLAQRGQALQLQRQKFTALRRDVRRKLSELHIPTRERRVYNPRSSEERFTLKRSLTAKPNHKLEGPTENGGCVADFQGRRHRVRRDLAALANVMGRT